jgi:predicted transcriptional regulator
MTRTIGVDQQVYDAIARLQARSGERSVNDAMRLLLGLPPKQRSKRPYATGAVTTALRDHPGATATKVAQTAGLAYSTTTSILAELEKVGLAQRTPDQSRRPGAITHRWQLSPPPPAPAAETVKVGELLFALQQQAADEAAEARDELAEQLAEDLNEDQYDLTEAMTTLAYRQPYARWWTTLTHHIQNGLDPTTALHKTLDAAHRTLLRIDARTPCTACPRTQDPLAILRQATSDFHHDTNPATLQTLHGITLPPWPATTDHPE